MTRVLLDFTLGHVVAIALSVAFVLLLEQVFGVSAPSAMGVVITLAATVYAAERSAGREGAAPSGGKAWTLAAAMALIALLLTNVVGGLALAVAPDPGLSSMLAALPVAMIVGAVAVFFLLHLLLIRVMFPIFVRSALKRRAAAR